MKVLDRRSFKAIPALLIILVLGLSSSDAGWVKQKKRLEGFATRPARALRFKNPVLRRKTRYAADGVLVRFRPDVSEVYAEGLLKSYGFPAVRKIPRIGVFAVRAAAGTSITETLAMLRRNPDVDLVRPNYLTHLAETPNDTYFASYQYSLRNRGTTLDIGDETQLQTKAGADIKATLGWDETKGDPEVVIAVLDSGIDLTHPDLIAKVVSMGRDFVNGDDDATDDNGHGTHVAGIAAADTDNAQGIAGVAWNCKVLPVKVARANGEGDYSMLIEGIIWATDQGAEVINLSMGGYADDPFLEEACEYAYDRGVVIAAAAGNEEGPVIYPAAYDDYVLAVAATDYNDEPADFSNFGPEVDVAAPGVWILSSVPLWFPPAGSLPYRFGSGTSQATPHVAGMAALIMSLKPGLKPAEVMKIIRYTADDVNRTTLPGRDDRIGYGRINIQRALAPYILK